MSSMYGKIEKNGMEQIQPLRHRRKPCALLDG